MTRDDLRTLTTGEFLHALRQVVAEKGESYTYPESERDAWDVCRYWHNGQPSCIIGHALDALGVVVPPSLEGMSANSIFREWRAKDPVTRAALAAQRAQDRGATWGEALSAAELEVVV